MHDLSYFRSNFDRIAQRLATRGDVSSLDRFRELEVEMQDGADDLADRVAARLREAGAGPPESTSKYRRALRALGRQV